MTAKMIWRSSLVLPLPSSLYGVFSSLVRIANITGFRLAQQQYCSPIRSMKRHVAVEAEVLVVSEAEEVAVEASVEVPLEGALLVAVVPHPVGKSKHKITNKYLL